MCSKVQTAKKHSNRKEKRLTIIKQVYWFSRENTAKRHIHYTVWKKCKLLPTETVL